MEGEEHDGSFCSYGQNPTPDPPRQLAGIDVKRTLWIAHCTSQLGGSRSFGDPDAMARMHVYPDVA